MVEVGSWKEQVVVGSTPCWCHLWNDPVGSNVTVACKVKFVMNISDTDSRPDMCFGKSVRVYVKRVAQAFKESNNKDHQADRAVLLIPQGSRKKPHTRQSEMCKCTLQKERPGDQQFYGQQRS